MFQIWSHCPPNPWTLDQGDPGPSTLNPEPCTLHPVPCTLNPQPSTLNPQLSTLNPRPYTLHPKAYTRNSTPNPIHRKPFSQHPTTLTLNPSPSNLNQASSTRRCGATGFNAEIASALGRQSNAQAHSRLENKTIRRVFERETCLLPQSNFSS